MANVRSNIEEQEAEWILLVAANEDYTGLYEAIWEFNSKFPNARLGEKYLAAERAIGSLLSRGLIELHRMLFSDDYKQFTYEKIDPVELDAILANPVSWYPDYAHARIVFIATAAGERAYFSGEGRPV